MGPDTKWRRWVCSDFTSKLYCHFNMLKDPEKFATYAQYKWKERQNYTKNEQDINRNQFNNKDLT